MSSVTCQTASHACLDDQQDKNNPRGLQSSLASRRRDSSAALKFLAAFKISATVESSTTLRAPEAWKLLFLVLFCLLLPSDLLFVFLLGFLLGISLASSSAFLWASSAASCQACSSIFFRALEKSSAFSVAFTCFIVSSAASLMIVFLCRSCWISETGLQMSMLRSSMRSPSSPRPSFTMSMISLMAGGGARWDGRATATAANTEKRTRIRMLFLRKSGIQ